MATSTSRGQTFSSFTRSDYINFSRPTCSVYFHIATRPTLRFTLCITKIGNHVTTQLLISQSKPSHYTPCTLPRLKINSRTAALIIPVRAHTHPFQLLSIYTYASARGHIIGRHVRAILSMQSARGQGL